MAPKSTDDAAARRSARLEASRLGAAAVKASFGAVLTRRRFAELVGVSTTTVRRWEMAGIVAPRLEVVLGSPTKVFQPTDVEFGRRLAALIRRHPGEFSLTDAAERVRRPGGP
jgi:hypothetical protein